MSGNRAIVLAGGGSRGAYQIGVWSALKEMDITYKTIVGTSVGALNGAIMACGDLETAKDVWSKISTEMILDYTPEENLSDENIKSQTIKAFMQKMLKEKGIDQTPLRNLLREKINVDKLYESPIDFGLVTVSYPSMRPHMLFKEDIEKEKFIDYLMATSAVFPAMKACKIDDELYIDGGFYDTMPIQMALDRGADEIIAVNLNAFGLYRKFDRQNVKITTISPKEPLGFELLFDAEHAQDNMQRGYQDTMKVYNKMDGFLYTFKKDTFCRYQKAFPSYLAYIFNKIDLPTKTDDSIINHMQMSIFKKLINETSVEFAFNNTMIAAAEITGKIFELSALSVYTKNEFDHLIFEKLHQLPPLKNERGRDRLRLLKQISNEQMITKYLLREIRSILSGKNDGTLFKMAASLYHGPTIAALYCSLSEAVDPTLRRQIL